MKYDDASWHYEGDFPQSSPIEYAGTHIALFLKWCIEKGWIGDLHLKENPDAVEQVLSGSLSATDFFFQLCDGKLSDEDLNDQGNRFAEDYYSTDHYFSDYAEHFGDLMYVASEEEHDVEKFKSMLDSRCASGDRSVSQTKTDGIGISSVEQDGPKIGSVEISSENVDQIIWDMPFFLAASKNRSYRENTRKTGLALSNFLNENALVKTLIELNDSTRILESHLTSDGVKVCDLALYNWLGGHDRGKDIEDVSILEKALAKVRSNSASK